MNAKLEDARAETSSKLVESRTELRHLLHDDAEEEANAAAGRSFPRSKTVRFLTSKKALGVLAIAAAGFLILRPRVATKLIRMVPVSAVARSLATRFLMSSGRKHEH